MNNNEQDFTRITDAHKFGYTGKNAIIIIVDVFDGGSDAHGFKCERRDLEDAPDATVRRVHWQHYGSHVFKRVKAIADEYPEDKCIIVDISMHWTHPHKYDPVPYDEYIEVKNRCIISAAVGNDGIYYANWPADGEDCIGRGAVRWDTHLNGPKYLNYSNKSPHDNRVVDGLFFTDYDVEYDTEDIYGNPISGFDPDFGGTSGGRNAGMIAVANDWFLENHGRKIEYWDFNAVMANFSYDMGLPTEVQGVGVVRLPLLDPHWGAPYRQYMGDHGMFTFNTVEELPYDEPCTRGMFIRAVAQVIPDNFGNTLKTSNLNRAVKHWNNCGLYIAGVNSQGDMAFDRVMTRGEMFVWIARILNGAELLISWDAVPKDEYYQFHIQFIVDCGFDVYNKNDNNKQVTFESALAMICRCLLGYKETLEFD